jgi:2'-hydroxyisoflavone reductase
VRLVADDRPGAFHAVGPAEPVTLGGLIETCARVAGTQVERVLHVSVEASEMVSIPCAELDALKAELRRLRRAARRGVARARIRADPGPGDDAPTFTRGQLAEAWELVSDRLVRFPGVS